MKPGLLLRSRQGLLKLGQRRLGDRERLKSGLSLRLRQLRRSLLGARERLKPALLLRSRQGPLRLGQSRLGGL